MSSIRIPPRCAAVSVFLFSHSRRHFQLRTARGVIDPLLVFGLDTQLSYRMDEHDADCKCDCDASHQHHHEHEHEHEHEHAQQGHLQQQHNNEIQTFHWGSNQRVNVLRLVVFLQGLSSEVFRVKGLLSLAAVGDDEWANSKPVALASVSLPIPRQAGFYMLNYAFGRWDFVPLTAYSGPSFVTFMGQHIASMRESCMSSLDQCLVAGSSSSEQAAVTVVNE